MPALSNESQNSSMYGFPLQSLPGKDRIRSDEYRIFAMAVFINTSRYSLLATLAANKGFRCWALVVNGIRDVVASSAQFGL
jgi:hypothetical protein